MELVDFVGEVSGKPLTDSERALMDEMRQMVNRYPPIRVVVVGDRFDRATAIGNLIHANFNRLEDHVITQLIKSREPELNRQLEKTIIFGTRYTHCWFDEFDGIKIKDVSPMEMYNLPVGHRGSAKTRLHSMMLEAAYKPFPMDHPERKREPKGPRGKWGKLK